MKADVIAFGAHPDDVELGCAGTLVRLAGSGQQVVIADLTRGEMGSRGTPEKRLDEAQKAAAILGISKRVNLELPDTELKNSRTHQLSIIEVVRRFRPNICLMNMSGDRHPDHNDATRLVTDALFYSGLQAIETRGSDGNLQSPHRPSHLLYYMLHHPFEPDFVFDISGTIDRKEAAIQAFESQFNIEDPGDEPETFISDPEFFKAIRARAKTYGNQCGFAYGEPFLYSKKPVPLTSFNVFDEHRPLR